MGMNAWLKNGMTHLICQNLLTQCYRKSKFEPLELILPTIYFTLFIRNVMSIHISFEKITMLKTTLAS